MKYLDTPLILLERRLKQIEGKIHRLSKRRAGIPNLVYVEQKSVLTKQFEEFNNAIIKLKYT